MAGGGGVPRTTLLVIYEELSKECPALALHLMLNGVEIPHGPQQSLGPGDRLSMALPGGGGFGLPKEREPERVARDVRLGYVSVKAALDDYGVVVDEQGVVDLPATKKARA